MSDIWAVIRRIGDVVEGLARRVKALETAGSMAYAPATHKILSLTHDGSTPATVVRGDLLTGQGAPALITRLGLGAVGTLLASDGTDVVWRSLASAGIVGGSGSAGQVGVWSGVNTLTGFVGLYYDSTGLGVGTSVPESLLHVERNGGRITQLIRSYADSALGNAIASQVYRGTSAAKTASQSGDVGLTYGAEFYDGTTALTGTNWVAEQAIADGAPATHLHNAAFRWATTAGLVRSTRMQLWSTGEITIADLIGLSGPTKKELLRVEGYNFNTVRYWNGTAYTNRDAEARSTGGTAFAMLAATSNYLYIGSAQIFSEIYVSIATAGAGVTLVAEYYNGSTWAALTVTDGTVNLTASGTISFTIPSDWAVTNINGAGNRYHVRLSTSSAPGTTPTCYFLAMSQYAVLGVYANRGDTNPALAVARNGAITINDDGNPYADLRVEGDTDANLLTTDASADSVGIGTAAPGAKLEVDGAASGITAILKANATTPGDLTQWQNSSGTVLVNIEPDGEIAIPQDSKAVKLGGGLDMSAYYDGTNGNLRTDLVAASDLNIGCGTDKTVVLTESVWVDIDFPIIIRTTGANIPTLTTVQGNLTMPQWAVNDFNQCESQEFVHQWKEGTTVYFHIHLYTNGLDATNRYVAFEVEYAWSNINGALSAAATISSGDLLIPANTTTKTMLLMSIGNFTPTGGKIGGHLIARLKRVAASGTAPTNNPWVPMLQIHVECDTLGSRQIGTK